MSFDERFLDELKARISLYSVISKKVKLQRKSGHSYAGLCPFHNEKTPSFIVDENKGFYHCFGCGAHGNIFNFMMNAFHMSFLESVETLAAQAGLQVPVLNREQQQKSQKRKSLFDIMQEACLFYEHKLLETEGAPARAYLTKRQITRESVARFRLGYAPFAGNMKECLLKKGAELKDLEDLGLLTKPDPEGFRKQKDYFYNRLIFPITDHRGKVIAFGGRLMTDGEPKYLNSPETELFHKSGVLYGLHQALDTVHKTGEILVCEGYMDVISLHQAGIKIAVAPLGTALTEDHLKLLWSLSDEPFLCFDGDGAGIKASYRARDRALPLLQEGKSLRFVFLPDGLDPDDFIKQKGASAFKEFLQKPLNLFDLVWDGLTSGRDFSTPERRAGLKKEIQRTVEQIQNQSVRENYAKQLNDKFYKMFSVQSLPVQKKSSQKPEKDFLLRQDDKTSLKTAARLSHETEEMRTFLSYLVCYPQVAKKRIEDFMALCVSDKKTAALHGALVQKVIQTDDPTREDFMAFLSQFPDSKMLFPAIERLNYTPRDDWTAEKELDKLFNLVHISSIDKELKDLAERLIDEPDLLNRYVALKKEKEQLLDESVF